MARGVRHDQQPVLAGNPKGQEPFFGSGMVWIRECYRQWIAKNSSRFIEADLVPSLVFRSLRRIPFEFHPFSIREVASANLMLLPVSYWGARLKRQPLALPRYLSRLTANAGRKNI